MKESKQERDASKHACRKREEGLFEKESERVEQQRSLTFASPEFKEERDDRGKRGKRKQGRRAGESTTSESYSKEERKGQVWRLAIDKETKRDRK